MLIILTHNYISSKNLKKSKFIQFNRNLIKFILVFIFILHIYYIEI